MKYGKWPFAFQRVRLLWVPKTQSASRDQAIFVDKPTEPIARPQG